MQPKISSSFAITVIIVLVGFFGLIFWLMGKRDIAPDTSKTIPPSIQENSTEQQSKADTVNAADWKTYKNEKHGYEIKYPRNWNIEFEGDSVFLDPGVGVLMKIVFEKRTVDEWVNNQAQMFAAPYEQIISKEEYSMKGVDGAIKAVYGTALGVNERNIVIPHVYGVLIFSFPDTRESVNDAFESVIATFEYM